MKNKQINGDIQERDRDRQMKRQTDMQGQKTYIKDRDEYKEIDGPRNVHRQRTGKTETLKERYSSRVKVKKKY